MCFRQSFSHESITVVVQWSFSGIHNAVRQWPTQPLDLRWLVLLDRHTRRPGDIPILSVCCRWNCVVPKLRLPFNVACLSSDMSCTFYACCVQFMSSHMPDTFCSYRTCTPFVGHDCRIPSVHDRLHRFLFGCNCDCLLHHRDQQCGSSIVYLNIVIHFRRFYTKWGKKDRRPPNSPRGIAKICGPTQDR